MSPEASSPIAETSLGALRGAWSDGVAVFRGVPYRDPPVGDGRFTLTEPIAPWREVREAILDGPIAPQPQARIRAAMGDYERVQNEDCLTLTIWTPAADRGLRPVLVWLHGGAYTTGAASLDWYDGSLLARVGDIVVVGVNYRLGALGYLCHPAIGRGNFGLGDQKTALEWVRDNIARFGGDPNLVTVCGQSAGAGSIAHLLLVPGGRDLFRRAILQSAPLGEAPLTEAEATETASDLLKLLGIDPSAADLRWLTTLPVAEILAAQVQIMRRAGGKIGAALPFGPVVADAQKARRFVETAAAATVGKDILIGWTREEMHAFLAADPAMLALDRDRLEHYVEELAENRGAIEPYRRRRPDGGPFDLLCDFLTHRRFSAASRDFAAIAASHGVTVWGYRFDWSPAQSLYKACHCIELPFVFGNWRRSWPGAGMLAGADATEMARLQRLMTASWIAFIRHGNPHYEEGPTWPRYTPDANKILSISIEPALTDWN